MKNSLRRFFINCLLVFSSAVLFCLSHPNFLIHKGLSFFAYIAFVPMFLLIGRIKFKTAFIWGGIYGALSYGLFASWLLFFHPLALPIILTQYFIFFALLFLCLKAVDVRFCRCGFIFQWLIFLGFEYVKTLGFLGFSYGIIGYTQWENILILQSASIFGVWGVSALVLFPSVCISAFLKKTEKLSGISIYSGNRKSPIYADNFLRCLRFSVLIWLGCFFGVLLYGLFSLKDYSKGATAKIALIQPNTDPWSGNQEVYRQDLARLKKLSNQALKKDENISLIVWPETAFVPRISWHYKYRHNAQTFSIVLDLLEYLNSQKPAFLIGNDDAPDEVLNSDNVVQYMESGQLDYNSALLFIPNKNVIPPAPFKYSKMRLVPFTEYFPYKDTFPQIYKLLIENDTHFWKKGSCPYIFSLDGMKFAVPICFEDTFGYISRDFARLGAEVIINITNDAWAESYACQYQHLSMSVFRAAENRLPLLRCAASGQTAYIDGQGRIVAMLEPFTEDFLIADVLLSGGNRTFYTAAGDFLGICFAVSAGIILIFVILEYILTTRKKITGKL